VLTTSLVASDDPIGPSLRRLDRVVEGAEALAIGWRAVLRRHVDPLGIRYPWSTETFYGIAEQVLAHTRKRVAEQEAAEASDNHSAVTAEVWPPHEVYRPARRPASMSVPDSGR
jgi:hypothetical protein